MRHLLADLMDVAAGTADYADVRHVSSLVESISTRNGHVDVVRRDAEEGFGVRVRVDGTWGFAAARGSERSAAEGALERAIAVAKAQPRVKGAVPLVPEAPAQGSYATALVTDPFDVPLDEKLALMLAADEGMRGDPRVTLTIAQYGAYRQNKTWASSDGALYAHTIVTCGRGCADRAARHAASPWRLLNGTH